METDISPQTRPRHATEKYGTKFVDKTENALKAVANTPSSKKDPPGGFDDTPIPRVPPGYTIKFTFHRAVNLPVADFNSLSSDPFVHAQLIVDLPRRHKQDPDVTFRTPTVRRDVNPVWDAEWIVGNVPASGFDLKCRVYDEDPVDHDDRLGNAHVTVDSIRDGWEGIKEKPYRIKKRAGSKRAYLFRTVAAACSRDHQLDAHLIVSVECLGRTPGDNGGHMYTVGPLYWFKHFSPLIGRLTKTTDSAPNQGTKGETTRYNFQAIEMQLKGPVPDQLYHRYVEFKPFVAGMFTAHSLRGRILNRALHHQHTRIYNFDRSTLNGKFHSPCIEFTQRFLEFVDYGQGGRIFTYVLTLDGQFRFTETGREFGIDLLSKHTMHSDVSIYIAFAGEFFVRPCKRHHRRCQQSEPQESHEPMLTEGEDAEQQFNENSDDPANFELIIDNASGTYRPNADCLPILRDFLSTNFLGLHVTTLDCQKNADRMNRLKEERRQEKLRDQGHIVYMQQSNDSSSSLSSSDEEEMDRRAGVPGKQRGEFAQNLHNLKDVKGKFRNWLEAEE
ncbi:hypothetical protein VTN77DRAFT_1681 [Rasamsonia byssochlamydoides]|uniref:uncharacterized protein n=1 Tax=Rasamsonia byssochlamydoides TaxID=89139 RepID=UPI0037431D6A